METLKLYYINMYVGSSTVLSSGAAILKTPMGLCK